MAKGDLMEPPPKPLPTPALDDHSISHSYKIGRGETGVLSFEPYKSLILPYWAFRTPQIASNSASILWDIFQSYCTRGDFVGADMTRKFIQMGMTRARRYANHKGGRKYGKDGRLLDKWTEEDMNSQRMGKEEASRIFKEHWQKCTQYQPYQTLRVAWSADKKDSTKCRTPKAGVSDAAGS